MKILLVNNFFGFSGGVGTYISAITEVLRNNGHDVDYYATDKKAYFDPNYKYLNYFPAFTDLRGLKKSESFKYLFKVLYNIEAAKNLSRLIDEVKPDVVHFNTISYHLTPSVLRACGKKKIPMVMTLHDVRLSCPNGLMVMSNGNFCKDALCVYGNPLHGFIRRCKRNSLSLSFMVTLEFMLNKVFGFYDNVNHFIAPSQAVLDLTAKYGIDANRLSHISNFHNDSFFETPPNYTNKGYLLYSGRIVREKGIFHLVNAMKQLPDIRLHVMGYGPDSEQLEQKLKDENIHNVEILGFRHQQELKDEYLNCIATVVPSNCYENCSYSIIEAFICGKPVIGSRIGAIPEMVEDDITGYNFEQGNVDDIVKKIKQLVDNPDKIVNMGKNARIKAENLYRGSVIYPKLIKVYESVVK